MHDHARWLILPLGDSSWLPVVKEEPKHERVWRKGWMRAHWIYSRLILLGSEHSVDRHIDYPAKETNSIRKKSFANFCIIEYLCYTHIKSAQWAEIEKFMCRGREVLRFRCREFLSDSGLHVSPIRNAIPRPPPLTAVWHIERGISDIIRFSNWRIGGTVRTSEGIWI